MNLCSIDLLKLKVVTFAENWKFKVYPKIILATSLIITICSRSVLKKKRNHFFRIFLKELYDIRRFGYFQLILLYYIIVLHAKQLQMVCRYLFRRRVVFSFRISGQLLYLYSYSSSRWNLNLTQSIHEIEISENGFTFH